MSHKGQEPDPRDIRYLQFVTARLDGLPDKEIAAKWDLSPAALYQCLDRDGYPVCSVCGAAPVGSGHCEQPPSERERLVRESGVAKDLPPASAATELFRERLGALVRAAEKLQYREEGLQGGRFVVTEVDPRAGTFHASSLSEEERNKISEVYGTDPKARIFTVPGIRLISPAGGSPAPPGPLPALITAYLLADGELEPLLEALHPHPALADREQIRKLLDAKKRKGGPHFDGLRVLAEQVAKVARGGGHSRGAPPPHLSNMEHNVACRITARREEGFTDEKIAADISHLKKNDGTRFTIEDVRRLGSLGLRYPKT